LTSSGPNYGQRTDHPTVMSGLTLSPHQPCNRPSPRSLFFEVRDRQKRRRMSTITVVPLRGGSAKVAIQTREHCPPHATCRDTGGQWVVRISFSFADATGVGLLDVMPPNNSPGPAAINALASAVQQNLHECRRLWWTYQQNNPLIKTEGACCLNNSRYGRWTVRNATYDPRTRETLLTFTTGQTLILPMS
jgi:hypothetical protein